ncbi:MAG: hypothetical protein IKW36_00300 [Alistipes sp.]|nr:hypothetical protein [Alistipes sp.]
MSKLFGTLLTLIAIAAMVYAIVSFGSYRSMIFDKETSTEYDLTLTDTTPDTETLNMEESTTAETAETMNADAETDTVVAQGE